MPHVLHTICYTKAYRSGQNAIKVLAELKKKADFVRATIETNFLLQLSPVNSIEANPKMVVLRAFFSWDENIYLPFLPYECAFVAIPEQLRDEYGILPTVKFTEIFDPPSSNAFPQ